MFTEATFEVLPRLNEIKFGSGVIDELLYLDMPRECRFPSGIMMLEYGRAVQESVYEQLRVVREGQLRIIFTQDLKVNIKPVSHFAAVLDNLGNSLLTVSVFQILSWEFCARRHEQLFPRHLVAPQVNQIVQVAQKCQSTISEGGAEGVSQQDLQTNSNMVLTAGRQLVKSLELQSLNDLGFSKRYVRCLQIAEVVNSMKDLIDFCRENKSGAIEGLKNYPRHPSSTKLQMQKMQEMEQITNVRGLPTDRNTLNKLMALHPGINNNPMRNNSHQMAAGRGTLSGSAQAALALSNYQNLLVRQNSINSNPNSLHQEASSSFNNSNQSPSSSFQGPAASLPAQQHTLSVTANNLIQQNHMQSSQGNPALQQQMIQLLQEMSNNNTGVQQLLQEMSNNNTGVQQQSVNGQNENGNAGRNTSALATATSTVSGSVAGPALSQSNSFKATSNDNSLAAGGDNRFNRGQPDLPQNLHSQDDTVPDIANDFMDNGFFNNDLDYNIGYGWKA
ncbi:hypothetical protein Goarm_015573 [Gossypium armourianum]|uniref:Transcriptional regulator SLK2 n=1 Tax=Gossypium armourianum TaxID=34283 RepID=A0A7J9JAG3_9ROSI|nr:hypothetical protein [Gossypium armourianum]